MGPIDDAIAVLKFIKANYPELNGGCFRYGRLEVTFKDGVVYSLGPYPHLVRGKDFQVSTRKDLTNKET